MLSLSFVAMKKIPPATKSKILSFFTDNEKKSKLKMELAIAIDHGQNFVKATYDLEGDGPLILCCLKLLILFVLPSKVWIVVPLMLKLLLMNCPEGTQEKFD